MRDGYIAITVWDQLLRYCSTSQMQAIGHLLSILDPAQSPGQQGRHQQICVSGFLARFLGRLPCLCTAHASIRGGLGQTVVNSNAALSSQMHWLVRTCPEEIDIQHVGNIRAKLSERHQSTER